MTRRTDPRQLALAARLRSLKQSVLLGSAGLAVTFWWLVAPAASTTNAATATTSTGSNGTSTSDDANDDNASTFFDSGTSSDTGTTFGGTTMTPVLRSHGS